MRNLHLLRDLRDIQWEIALGSQNLTVPNAGCFNVLSPHDQRILGVIAAIWKGWDHISVSRADRDRIPSWTEMEYVKRIFFEDNEVAMQLHVPIKDHINNNPGVLHLWRPHYQKIPLPPKELV